MVWPGDFSPPRWGRIAAIPGNGLMSPGVSQITIYPTPSRSLRVTAKQFLGGDTVARKTIRVSDQSGDEIPEGKGATIRITFADARKGVRELDVTDAEAEKLGGRAVARRGRKPKAASSS